MFWTEEVENELGRWEEEKQTLAEVNSRADWPALTCTDLQLTCTDLHVQIKSKLEQAHSQTSKPARVADKCLRLREERIGQDKVVDLVEESLMMELNNVKIWQMRIKTAIEQVSGPSLTRGNF